MPSSTPSAGERALRRLDQSRRDFAAIEAARMRAADLFAKRSPRPISVVNWRSPIRPCLTGTRSGQLAGSGP